MAELVPDAGFLKNGKLKNALLQHKALSRSGLSERLFGLLFSGLVYPQIWEDPDVDMAGMELAEVRRWSVSAPAAATCSPICLVTQNRSTWSISNPHHIALNKLKVAAFRALPGHSDVVRFLATENASGNVEAFDAMIGPALDDATRQYWQKRKWNGQRRIDVFERNIYRTGLLGRFIAVGHLLARLHGVKLADLAQAKSVREQRQFFDTQIAPLFDKPLIRWLTSRKSSLFGLGIPPQQFDELATLAADGSIAPVLRQRLEKLTCHFPLKDNYFAWQAFIRRYAKPEEGSLPTYLKPEHYRAIRENAGRVQVHHATFTELLATKSAGSLIVTYSWMRRIG